MEFSPDVCFAAGMALPNETTPIAVQYDLLLLTFTFNSRNGVILETEANMVCDITSQYLRQLLVGRCIYTDQEMILKEIKRDYFGLNRRALLICVKDAVDKMCERSQFISGQMILAQSEGLKNMPKTTIDKPQQSVYYCEKESSVLNWENTICVAGLAKTGSRNPITRVHQMLFASIVVDRDSGEIMGAEFNTVCRLTNRFLVELLLGKSLKDDVEQISQEILNRYFGDSRRAIVSILKDAQNRFLTYQNTVRNELK